MGRVHHVEILPKQADFIESQDLFLGLLGGFGSGKTNIGAKWFIDRMMENPLGTHAIANRDLGQYKRGTIKTLQDELKERGILFFFNSSDGILTIRKNGAKIVPLSAENYENWRALEADTIWADEVTTWGPQAARAFTEFLVPRRRLSPEGVRFAEMRPGYKALLRFTTNPPTDTAHWLYDLTVRKHFCKVIHMSTRDNYLMRDLDEYIDALQRAYSPDLWPIYIDGNWGNATQGSVYKGFDLEKHVTTDRKVPLPSMLAPFRIDRSKPLCWALDFNVGLMCSTIGQWHRQSMRNKTMDATPHLFKPITNLKQYRSRAEPDFQTTYFYVHDEMRMEDAGTPDVIQEFLRRYKTHAQERGVIIYGDASAGARSQTMSAQSAARSNWGLILGALKFHRIPYEFKVQKTNPAVMDRINATKVKLFNADGIGVIIDGEKAPFLVQDYQAVKFKQGTNDIDKENDKLTHLSDGIGYMFWLEHTLLDNSNTVEFLDQREV